MVNVFSRMIVIVTAAAYLANAVPIDYNRPHRPHPPRADELPSGLTSGLPRPSGAHPSAIPSDVIEKIKEHFSGSLPPALATKLSQSGAVPTGGADDSSSAERRELGRPHRVHPPRADEPTGFPRPSGARPSAIPSDVIEKIKEHFSGSLPPALATKLSQSGAMPTGGASDGSSAERRELGRLHRVHPPRAEEPTGLPRPSGARPSAIPSDVIEKIKEHFSGSLPPALATKLSQSGAMPTGGAGDGLNAERRELGRPYRVHPPRAEEPTGLPRPSGARPSAIPSDVLEKIKEHFSGSLPPALATKIAGATPTDSASGSVERRDIADGPSGARPSAIPSDVINKIKEHFSGSLPPALATKLSEAKPTGAADDLD